MIEQREQNVAPITASIHSSGVADAGMMKPAGPRPPNRKIRLVVLCAVAVSVPAVAIAYFGSFRTMASYLNGHRVIADHQEIDLGNRQAGEICERLVTIRNFRDVPISVTGVSLSCTCISVSPLPLNIEHGGSASFNVRVRMVSKNDRFDQTVTFLTNDETDPGLAVRIRGSLTDAVPNADRGSG